MTILEKVKGAKRLTQLLILLSFLITFVIARFTVWLGVWLGIPSPNVFRGVRVHHLVPGIILILISGYIGLSFWRNRYLRWAMAVFFGIGAALTIDEFALWLYLSDVYWERQGRYSIDAFIVVAVLLVIAYIISEIRGHRTIRKIPLVSIFIKQPRV